MIHYDIQIHVVCVGPCFSHLLPSCGLRSPCSVAPTVNDLFLDMCPHRVKTCRKVPHRTGKVVQLSNESKHEIGLFRSNMVERFDQMPCFDLIP